MQDKKIHDTQQKEDKSKQKHSCVCVSCVCVYKTRKREEPLYKSKEKWIHREEVKEVKEVKR
jgi:hypothetical protein